MTLHSNHPPPDLAADILSVPYSNAFTSPTPVCHLQMKCHPKHGYMRKQPDITNCMRVILMDWLVEVCLEYKLCNETFFLAVNYIDRFLSCMSVLRGKLQLLGTAAIMLAA